MSFNTSVLLVILLVCISLHACNARRLAVYKSRAHNDLHFSNPNEEKMVSVGAAKAIMSNNTSSATTGEDDHVLKNKQKKVMAEKKGGKESAAVSEVPWEVPHNKDEEKHPGFDLDYAPPKTHPPSHN